MKIGNKINKKIFLIIPILLIALYFSVNMAMAGTADCTNDCSSSASCPSGTSCGPQTCTNGAKDFVYVCSQNNTSATGEGNQTESGQNIPTTNYCGSGYTLQGDACVPNSSAPNLDTGGFSSNPNDYTSATQSSHSDIIIPETGLANPPGGLKTILNNILNWVLGILGFLGLIGFIISGIMYLSSAGNDDAVKKAKKAMTASIVGVIIGLGGFVAIQAINAILNVSSKQF